MAKFTVFKRSNGEFQFNLKADNGEVILTSEGYSNSAACANGIESVKKNSQLDDRFEERTARNNFVYFVLKAANGQIIGSSDLYSSITAMRGGMDAVRTGAASAGIEEKY